MTLDTWIAFSVAAWLISLSPGAGAVSCMAVGMRLGYARALWNILGLQLGIVLVLALVATGLGALLAASTLAFATVKWLGVAYLVWLGIAQWRAAPVAAAIEGPATPRPTRGGACSRAGCS
jgi:homoserine/homoserine lactone efflux protein